VAVGQQHGCALNGVNVGFITQKLIERIGGFIEF
jgi:hypothetical protein